MQKHCFFILFFFLLCYTDNKIGLVDVIEIREMTKDDFFSVSSLIEEAFGIRRKNYLSSSNQTELVAYYGDVVGYLLLTRFYDPIKSQVYFKVDYVCVRKTFRGQGIGKLLMNTVYEMACKEKAAYIELTSGYARATARKMYESLGYVCRESNIFRKVIL